MKYRNAKEVLPAELLAEIQRYAGGELLYIPTPAAERTGWGEKSGARTEYEERNQRIRAMYADDLSYEELADRFFLSVDSIRKIVRTSGNYEGA